VCTAGIYLSHLHKNRFRYPSKFIKTVKCKLGVLHKMAIITMLNSSNIQYFMYVISLYVFAADLQ